MAKKSALSKSKIKYFQKRCNEIYSTQLKVIDAGFPDLMAPPYRWSGGCDTPNKELVTISLYPPHRLMEIIARGDAVLRENWGRITAESVTWAGKDEEVAAELARLRSQYEKYSAQKEALEDLRAAVMDKMVLGEDMTAALDQLKNWVPAV